MKLNIESNTILPNMGIRIVHPNFHQPTDKNNWPLIWPPQHKWLAESEIFPEDRGYKWVFLNKLCKWGCWFITAQQPNFSSYLEQDGKRKQKQYWCQDFRSGKNWEAGEIRNYLCFLWKWSQVDDLPSKILRCIKDKQALSLQRGGHWRDS